MARADRYFAHKRLVVFDVDGTLALGKRALPGALELIESLHRRGVSVVYLSNDTGYTKEVKAERLRAAGLPVGDVDSEVKTPLDALVLYLGACPYQRLFLAATPEVAAWMRPFGIAHHEHDPELIVLCRDTTLDYHKLSRITIMVHHGVPYVASNPDNFYPTPDGPGVDLAGLIELIAVTTGGIRPLEIFGKPNTSMLDAIARPRGLSPDQVLMVGDRLHTDIRMAQDFGCDSVVVLSGDTTAEKLSRTPDIRPTHVVAGVHVLAESLR